MTCIHGLNEINCPICRVSSSSIPKQFSKIPELYENDLKPFNPHLEKNLKDKEKFRENLHPFNAQNDKKLRRNIPTVNMNLNPNRNFRNRMFEERMAEIDITKSKKYEYLKKKRLLDPKSRLLNNKDDS
ncbi:MAG: hypothetical protein P8Y70_03415 [Candidatus Lokiarchaeota archaeon]